MKDTKNKNSERIMIETVELDRIILDAIKDEFPRNLIPESYVAEPKAYPQVSEMVSSRTKEAHMELYKDYVEMMNRVSAELDAAPRGVDEVNSNHSRFRSLKLDESYNVNAAWLHELYFANCFDPHSEIHMDSLSFMRLERDFGTFDDWQRDLFACALSAGEGWVVCGYHMFLKRYVNMVVSHHSGDVMVGVYPVFVVDMWSHAYNRDYLNDKESYLTSRMREIDWNVVEERFAKAEAIHEAIK